MRTSTGSAAFPPASTSPVIVNATVPPTRGWPVHVPIQRPRRSESVIAAHTSSTGSGYSRRQTSVVEPSPSVRASAGGVLIGFSLLGGAAGAPTAVDLGVEGVEPARGAGRREGPEALQPGVELGERPAVEGVDAVLARDA